MSAEKVFTRLVTSSISIAERNPIIGGVGRSSDVLARVHNLSKVLELITTFRINKIDIILNKAYNSMLKKICILFGNRLTSPIDTCENRANLIMGRQYDGAAYIRAMKSLQILPASLSVGVWTNARILRPNDLKLFRSSRRQCLNIHLTDSVIGRRMC